MPLQIIHEDITRLVCDAIVDPTDPVFSGSGGTDLAIHTKAGAKLRQECDRLPPLSEGEIALTGGYELPCRYVIHTVGPIWMGGGENERVLLRSCYLNALFQAGKMELSSVAFPLIASGTFGFPKDKVLRIAIDAIADYLMMTDGELDVYICVPDPNAYTLSREIALREYLSGRTDACVEDKVCLYGIVQKAAFAETDLTQWLKKQDDSFAVTLFKLIDKSGMTDIQCYKKANVSKQTFYKIKNERNYKPSKVTAVGFAIALRLDLEQTKLLLQAAGLSLSHNNLFDMIVEFYITNGIYDLFEINAALYQYDQTIIG